MAQTTSNLVIYNYEPSDVCTAGKIAIFDADGKVKDCDTPDSPAIAGVFYNSVIDPATRLATVVVSKNDMVAVARKGRISVQKTVAPSLNAGTYIKSSATGLAVAWVSGTDEPEERVGQVAEPAEANSTTVLVDLIE